MLGAPLQFFPALGTKELDDMLDAYIPGPASLKEKRATVSVDFLEYTQRTGQAFKFYVVPGFTTTASGSPATASASSVHASPVASSWDWTSVTDPTPSRASTHTRASRKSSTATAGSRRTGPTDFSHLPGMKILTKDGLDVTNSASRGSKTKEQRDHAHLMRIIKACDSCKKKKIRCDPSHKKRAPASQAPAQAHPAAKTSRKARPPAQDKPSVIAPAPAVDGSFPIPEAPSLDFDSALEFPEFESFDISTAMHEPWEDFIHYPPAGIQPDYDFLFDPQGYLLPQDQQTSSSSSASPFMSNSEDQLFSQTFLSSTSSSDSSDLVDYSLFTTTSSSTSPEMSDLDSYDLDGYVIPPDLSLSTSPEVPDRDRHVLPQYPMPPGSTPDQLGSLERSTQSQPMSTSASSSSGGVDSRVVHSPWSVSSDPRVVEELLQSQPRSPDLTDNAGNAESQSASPTSLGLNNYVESKSSTLVRSSRVATADTRSEDGSQLQTALPSAFAEGALQQQFASSEQASQLGRVGVPPIPSPDPRGVDDNARPASVDVEGCILSQSLAAASSGRLRQLTSPSTLLLDSAATEQSAPQSSSEPTEAMETESAVMSQTSRDQSRDVAGFVIRRSTSASGSAPLSSRLHSAASLPEYEVVRQAAGELAEGVEAYGLDSTNVHAPAALATGLCMSRPEVPGATTMAPMEVPSMAVPGLQESLTGTDCVLEGQTVRSSTPSSLALAGVSICAALELLAGRKMRSKAKVDSWKIGLLALVPLAAFASSLASFG
jgi:hypothetical protein